MQTYLCSNIALIQIHVEHRIHFNARFNLGNGNVLYFGTRMTPPYPQQQANWHG